MPTAAKSKRRVARGCAIGGAELRLKGLKKSDRRHGGASLVRCRKFRPVAGGLYRSLTGYVVKIKTDAGKVRFIGPRGVARLQSRAKRFDTQSEAKLAAESTIASGYGKIRSAIVVKVVAGAKKASGRKSVKNGRTPPPSSPRSSVLTFAERDAIAKYKAAYGKSWRSNLRQVLDYGIYTPEGKRTWLAANLSDDLVSALEKLGVRGITKYQVPRTASAWHRRSR